jgi:dihydrofolate reductase
MMTRRLIQWNLMTLDGCFDGAQPWALDFHLTAWGEELEQYSLHQGAQIGTLLFGRATYEGMAAYWTRETGAIADMMNNMPKVVFSNTLRSADWNNTRLIAGEAADAVAAMKREEGQDLYIFGSAKLCDGLMRRGLFDEYRICLAPIVLDSGVPLFKPGVQRHYLKLLEARPLKTGAVVLRYAPGTPPAAAG